MKEYVTPRPKLFVIDDDPDLASVLQITFDMNKAVLPEHKIFTDTNKFFEAMTPEVSICVVDYFLKGMTGIDVMKKVNKTNPNCWFIMFSGQTSLHVVADFVNNSYGSRYVEKGRNDSLEKLLFFIKDAADRLKIMETYFFESFKNRKSLSKLTDRLTELKDKL